MKRSKKILIGMIAGSLLLTAGTAYAWKAYTKNISVRYAGIKLIVNGIDTQTKAEPFIYNGNVYAPVATVANMLDIKQEWDNQTPAVRFSSNGLTGFTGKAIDSFFKETAPLTWLSDNIYFGKLKHPMRVELRDPKNYPYYENTQYAVVDLSDFKRVKTLPVGYQLQWENYEKIEVVTEGFVNVRGNSNNQFIVYEQIASQDKKGYHSGRVTLYQYKNDQLLSEGQTYLFEELPYEAKVNYLKEARQFVVDFYDSNGKYVTTVVQKLQPDGFYVPYLDPKTIVK